MQHINGQEPNPSGKEPGSLPPNIQQDNHLNDSVLYRERLNPTAVVWMLTVAVSFVPSVIFVPIDIVIGIIASIITLLVLIFAMIASTPTILVTPTSLRVGRAQIDRTYLGRVDAFRKEEATAQRGPDLHGLTHLCIRGWIDAVVKIEITDSEDRTPHWLVSSRHPDELAELLSAKPN